MRLRDQQGGFTLVELLVTSTIGMVVLLSLFGLVDVTQRGSSRVAQRVDATQRGRTAMEQMTQALRSTMCVKPVTAPADSAPGVIASGDDRHVTVYTAIHGAVPGQAAPSAQVPERREYRHDPGVPGDPADDRITETVWSGVGTVPSLDFPAVTRQRALLTHAVAPSAGPVFSYFAYLADGTLDPTPLPTPLSDADRARVVRIGVHFVSRPSDGSSERAVQTPFRDLVSVRLPVDPKQPGAGPTCAL